MLALLLNLGVVIVSLPCLFLPGTLCDERVWLPVWKTLSIPQCRYVPLQWATSLNDMLSLTDDRLLDGEKVHVIGFSMGGYIAARWATENPDQVASLTLIGYSPYGLSKDEISRRQQLIAMLKEGQFHPQKPAYLSRFIHPSHMQSEHVAGVVTEMGRDLGAATLIAHTQATTPRESLVPLLNRAPFPVHIIGASEDMVVPQDTLHKAHKAISGSTLTVISDTGHMCLLERPEEVARLLTDILQ